MIEQGANVLKEVVFSIPDIAQRNKNKAEEYYRQIIDLAFQWQRSGKIRQAYRQAMDTVKLRPYKKRVLTGQFNAMVLEFEDEMNRAIKDQELEKAIKWRDAIYKLKNGMDIYDVLHVVDDLRQARHLPSLKDYWEHSPEEFSAFAKKHFVDFQKKRFIQKQPKHFLNEIKDRDLKNLLLKAVDDPSPEVSITASYIAILKNYSFGEKKLRKYFYDPDTDNARFAAAVLGKLPNKCLRRSEERRVGKECRSRWSP